MQCPKCKIIFPISEKIIGRRVCKKCDSFRKKEWVKHNYQRKLELNRQWRIKVGYANNTKYANNTSNTIKRYSKQYGLGFGTIARYGLKLALSVYDRDKRACRKCGETIDLTLHHLDRKGRNYENKGLKPNNVLSNLIVLCRSCHGRIHGKQNKKRKECQSETNFVFYMF